MTPLVKVWLTYVLVSFVIGFTLMAFDEYHERGWRWFLFPGLIVGIGGLLLFVVLTIWIDQQ